MHRIAKIYRGCLLAAGLSLLPMTSVHAAPVFAVSSAPSVFRGSHITVSVLAQALIDLYDYQFDLVFDPTKLQFVSNTEGPFLATAGSTFFFEGIPGAGNVSFVFDTLLGPGPGATGSGLLAAFDFLAIGVGTSTVSLANVLAQDTPGNLINVGLGSATVQVIPEPATLGLLALALAGLMASARKRKATM